YSTCQEESRIYSIMVKEIKELCKKNNTSIKALERLLDLSNGSIRNWDTKPPSYDKVEKVAKYFNVSIEYIIGTETEETHKEKEIIAFYRKADDRGKNRIYKTAKDEAEQAEQLLQQKENITEFSKEIKPFA
ncbi:MAG: helix-turn-helix transcriptional regulator, partial [Lachnospiraceae bacterium]|nr:helix-turn-helix transcriptional regulator [Lachnospiraceae bacterium]